MHYTLFFALLWVHRRTGPDGAQDIARLTPSALELALESKLIHAKDRALERNLLMQWTEL